MVVPIVARRHKEKHKKPFLQRAWPFILGTGFIATVITAIIVAVVTGVKVFAYLT